MWPRESAAWGFLQNQGPEMVAAVVMNGLNMVCALQLDSAFSQELEEWIEKQAFCACSDPCCWAGQLLCCKRIFGFFREALLLSHQTLHSAGRRHSSSCESGRIQHTRDDCKVCWVFFCIFFPFLKDLYVVCFFVCVCFVLGFFKAYVWYVLLK